MADLYHSDLEGQTTNAAATGWVDISNSFRVYTYAATSTTSIAGTQAFFSNAPQSFAAQTAIGVLANQAIRFAARVAALTTAGFAAVGATLRSQNTVEGIQYRVYLATDGAGLRLVIDKYSQGGVNVATSTSFAFKPAPGDVIHFEARAVGSTIEGRAWLNSNARPATADNSAAATYATVTANDTTHASGYAGLFFIGASTYAPADQIVITDGAGGEDYYYPASTPVSFSGPVPTRNGTVGAAASFANAGFFAGSLTPFTYTLQAGVLPAGLTLSSSTGIVSGTPTAAGTQSGIVVRAADTGGNTADTNAYSIVIAASNASPTFPGSISNITGTAGVAITPVNVSGQFSDTDALAYTPSPAGTAWPSGLVVDGSTGIISGTVATSTTTGLKVRATDTASQSIDSNAFNVTISSAATGTITIPPLANNTKTRWASNVNVSVNISTTAYPPTQLLALTGRSTDASGNLAPISNAALYGLTSVRAYWKVDSGDEGMMVLPVT